MRATPWRKGGKLVVETRNMCSTPTTADFQSELKPGEYVQLSISDTGAGWHLRCATGRSSRSSQPRRMGRGTGLGLAMVYGFVKQSGGHVTIYSEVGHGTTIQSVFPARRRGPWVQTRPRSRVSLIRDARETILVVEDDARVRQLTITRLKMIGYQVLEASDGPKALDILRRDSAVDLVFTDLVMPGGLSGREVAVARPSAQARHQSAADLRLR